MKKLYKAAAAAAVTVAGTAYMFGSDIKLAVLDAAQTHFSNKADDAVYRDARQALADGNFDRGVGDLKKIHDSGRLPDYGKVSRELYKGNDANLMKGAIAAYAARDPETGETLLNLVHDKSSPDYALEKLAMDNMYDDSRIAKAEDDMVNGRDDEAARVLQSTDIHNRQRIERFYALLQEAEDGAVGKAMAANGGATSNEEESQIRRDLTEVAPSVIVKYAEEQLNEGKAHNAVIALSLIQSPWKIKDENFDEQYFDNLNRHALAVDDAVNFARAKAALALGNQDLSIAAEASQKATAQKALRDTYDLAEQALDPGEQILPRGQDAVDPDAGKNKAASTPAPIPAAPTVTAVTPPAPTSVPAPAPASTSAAAPAEKDKAAPAETPADGIMAVQNALIKPAEAANNVSPVQEGQAALSSPAAKTGEAAAAVAAPASAAQEATPSATPASAPAAASSPAPSPATPVTTPPQTASAPTTDKASPVQEGQGAAAQAANTAAAQDIKPAASSVGAPMGYAPTVAQAVMPPAPAATASTAAQAQVQPPAPQAKPEPVVDYAARAHFYIEEAKKQFALSAQYLLLLHNPDAIKDLPKVKQQSDAAMDNVFYVKGLELRREGLGMEEDQAFSQISPEGRRRLGVRTIADLHPSHPSHKKASPKKPAPAHK